MENKKRILVVDDEAQITLVLRSGLSKHGYEIRVAPEGETALDKDKEQKCKSDGRGIDITVERSQYRCNDGYAEHGQHIASPLSAQQLGHSRGNSNVGNRF